MNRMIVSVLAAGLMVSAAFAQDAASSAAVPEDANAPSIAVEGGAPVELAAPETETDVQIVRLSELPDTETAPQLSEDQDELAALRASIVDNAQVKAKLDAGGYTLADVVAMETNVDGTIIVYVDDRS